MALSLVHTHPCVPKIKHHLTKEPKKNIQKPMGLALDPLYWVGFPLGVYHEGDRLMHTAYIYIYMCVYRHTYIYICVCVTLYSMRFF